MSCLVCGHDLPAAGAISGPDRQEVAAGTFEVRVCPSCGGGTSLPVVASSELGAFYPDAYGPHERGGASGPLARAAMSMRLRTRLFRALGRPDPGEARLLDVGAGAGDLGRVLAGRGWRVTGIEPSPQACEVARGNGIEARIGTLDTVDLEPSSFDAAVFHHSLEHLADPLAGLRAVHAALRPGGEVAIAVPNFDSPQRRRLGDTWWALDLPRHRFHFTPASLELALRETGFEPRWVRPTVSVLGPAANLQSRFGGRMAMTGPGFLAGYGLAVAAYPFRWAAGEARGSGEFLAAIASRA